MPPSLLAVLSARKGCSDKGVTPLVGSLWKRPRLGFDKELVCEK